MSKKDAITLEALANKQAEAWAKKYHGVDYGNPLCQRDVKETKMHFRIGFLKAFGKS